MKIFKSHILLGTDSISQMQKIRDIGNILKAEIKKNGLEEDVKVLESGTLGVFGFGITMLVYPEGIYYANLDEIKIKRIVEEHLLNGRIVEEYKIEPPKAKKDLTIKGKQERIVLNNVGLIDPRNIDDYIARDGYKALEKALFEMKPQDVIEEVKKSNLRGRGGAGFPTGLKWSFTAPIEGEKFIVCNADEGEPGTFKDRLIMEGDPHKLIEAMILSGYAVGAQKGYIYIRGEYKLSIEIMQNAIKQAKQYGLLGDNILESGFNYDIEIKKGAGAYVCGEETALIESVEGKRGNPRIKPPFPGVKGLWEKPTVVNNVETLSNIPSIIVNGADWYKQFGTEKSTGTKVYTILGHVNYPGLVEVPMGTTLREIIFTYGGGIKADKKFKSALVGGAAGAFLGEDMLDVPMDFDNLGEYKAVLGSGAVLVMDEDVDILDILENLMEFFNHESCGQCSPCRIGNPTILKLIRKLKTKDNLKGNEWEAIEEIAEAMKETSLCALGQSPILPISSALKYFGKELGR